uniref:Capping protein inhibiting regulator of actin dynamics n=1 Tax=Taeniopygia guttata TaxID=59729 RepID=A0A674H7R4_TAEGU|nr:capping protein inhibiting regulator of actin dynamics isoform X1 [Taeniopygia guttata]XP_030126988.3 capping protein inhibiting regulator of actin dynamics isoform X1 [Taeniopygia guttata]XP_030126989.3 capping protein inhibiting regulator of actin dynamics isoform X1 [Taeniopygia guttata]XP_030126990.3 capping protein inhibiting regulator of actin dynamics isoform X1 [Taeniopygia guttata]XP_030126991.3 capping protein inhibiting regulator of actin dynamics isoform X1 [Taeniopygia guttata]
MINLFKKPYKKKAGKFQPFKKLFGKRKKREPASECEEPKLKPSHSFGSICNGAFSSDEERGGLRSSHYSMGSRAFSHDSIFIPDGRTESEQAIQAMSQENVLGKVKILQQQLAKNIKFGQPPQMTISARTMGEANASTEDDALLSSPMETETQQDTAISDCSNKSTDTPDFLRKMNFLGTGHEIEEKVTPIKSTRPKRQFSCSGTIETINLDSVPQALARLDNSAAKHKLSVKPKKQRMSRQHKRLTKGSQSLTITEFEPEDLETQLYEDIYPGYNGRFTADKLIQDRDEQKQLQLAEEKRIEDHWGILEAERIRQIVEMEEQREMEEKRCQELEEMQKEQEKRCCEEDRRQYLLEGETSLKIEEQTCHKEERRLMKAEKMAEMEDQVQKELEKQQRQNLEEKRHWEVEEQQRRELEEQKLKEHEEQQRQELEVQKLKEQEEQQRQELEVQKLKEQEKQQRQELEMQKLKEQEEQQRRELEVQKLKEQEEQQRRELEVQKLKEQEEQQRQELEVSKLKEQEEHKREELDRQQHQQWEEQQRLKQEEEKNQEQEEQQRRELEEQKHQEQEEQRCQELEEKKHQEWEEQKHKALEEKQRQELEEQKRLAPEELKQHRTEKDSQKEEERNWLEEQTELKKQIKEEIQRQELERKELEEVEIKLNQEEEPESLKQEKEQEEQRQHLKEKEKTEKEQPQQVTDKKQKREEQRKHKLTKQMHMESSDYVLQDEVKQQKEENGHECNKLKEQKIDTEGQNLQPKQKKSLEQPQEKDQLCSAGGAARHPAEEKLQEGSSSQKVKQPEKGTKTAEEILAQKLKREVEAQEQKRIGEELRWQEVDERQMASRPFTFQVSSGDKQIIFQKVNLSPVMPIKGAGLSSPSAKDSRVHATSKGSHSLPSSVCVPHTAILVTGAQLCGTAVNLNQIKDTACKSLLGLTEERKNVDIPSPEKSERKKQDPKPSSSKMKQAQEALNNQAVLAEWASIRSRILKNAENNKYNERDRVTACRHSDDWTPRGRGAPHGNLRKTLSANAKFSITPAWQKFSDVSKTNSDAENVHVAKGNETVAVGRTTGSSADSKEDVVSTYKDNLAEKPKEKMETHREVTDNTEGCKFAKDLPSFLVPNFPHSMGKESSQPELPNALENQQSNSTKKADKPPPNGEENVSPFGIKLRRTNYSLRFHYDQQAEQKKKKRYSAGDSFDGVPDPLTSTEGEKESSVFTSQESTSPGTGRANIPGNLKDSSVTVVEFSTPVGTPVVPPATGQSALPAHEKPASKSLVPQKPALAPKPTSQTPPPSPLSKMNRSNLSEMLGQRVFKAESDGGWRKEDRPNAAQPIPSNDYKNEEEEIKEKKSFFPSLSIPWREKNDKKPEPLKKEKPVLQSRHSVDGSKLLEKVETSQPLWITLALQKQKGFREQQATREERRQAREAKQAEKLAKENAAVSNQSDNKSSSSKTSTLQKSTTQEGEKKIDTTVSRLERREHLKKSNTLPTSVTVEISDSVPSTPVTKEVAKRFSTPDANPVSTEPAWLALAKRKAKAWSDCPQIIK